MFHRTSIPPVEDAAVQAYLRQTLGLASTVRDWEGLDGLPYYLQEAFTVRELLLLDRHVLLAIDRHAGQTGLLAIRDQLDRLTHVSGMRAVYVTHSLASYERRHLIQQKVPFLVPGNQLYLPDLGIDLREYFRRPRDPGKPALSPATQAMLIMMLLRDPWDPEWQPAAVVGQLGYTAMTLSRAVREIVSAGIASVRSEGRVRWLRAQETAARTWEIAKPLLRSPVRRRVWVVPAGNVKLQAPRLAGLSALARQTMLAEPLRPIYAIDQKAWRAARQAGMVTVPEPVPEASEWEIWHYDPALVPGAETVDPLSLTLSLADDPDERVQLALEELEVQFPW